MDKGGSMKLHCQTTTAKVELDCNDDIVQIVLNNKLIACFDISSVWDLIVCHLSAIDTHGSISLERRQFEAWEVKKSTSKYLKKLRSPKS